MENLILLTTIAAVNLAGVVSPGPDFVITVRNSLKYSRKTGIYTAIGFGLGIAIHIAYCIAGLAFIISKSIIVFSIIKYLGAAYLIYIGLKSIFSKSAKIRIGEIEKEKEISRLKAIQIGFLTNVLNPKATLFYLGLFTFIIKPDTPALILAAASLVMIATIIGWFSLVAIFFTHNRIRRTYEKFQKSINRTLGGFLLLLGINIALAKN